MTTTSKNATAPPRLAATINVVLPTTPDGIESLPIPRAGRCASVRACVGGWCRRFLSGCPVCPRRCVRALHRFPLKAYSHYA
jgi:hypothetical protein